MYRYATLPIALALAAGCAAPVAPANRAATPSMSAPERVEKIATSTAPVPGGVVPGGVVAGDVWAQPDTWTPAGDPSKNEVVLPASGNWNASLVIDNGEVGIWTVEAFPVFDMYATPEVVGLDDRGRCHILSSYSGKWADLPVIHDSKWLGGLAHGDVDPRFPGAELYTGGQRGNLYQVLAYPHAAVDHRLITFLPGMEIHTIVQGDLDPRTPGKELIVFTRPGGLYRCTPTGPDGGWVTENIDALSGRVRDAVVLPQEAGRPAEIATVSRAGWLKILSITDAGPQWETAYETEMGMGRLAVRAARPGEPLVLYTTHDDGRILRHERGADRQWTTDVVYLGPQGARGLATGQFDADLSVETIAVFGYSGKVELLSRRASGWAAETIFEDRHKGHWLTATELDGRNDTTELLASGYGGRIVLLSRPPGTGRTEPHSDHR